MQPKNISSHSNFVLKSFVLLKLMGLIQKGISLPKMISGVREESNLHMKIFVNIYKFSALVMALDSRFT